jgi:hypothetical protein
MVSNGATPHRQTAPAEAPGRPSARSTSQKWRPNAESRRLGSASRMPHACSATTDHSTPRPRSTVDASSPASVAPTNAATAPAPTNAIAPKTMLARSPARSANRPPGTASSSGGTANVGVATPSHAEPWPRSSIACPPPTADRKVGRAAGRRSSTQGAVGHHRMSGNNTVTLRRRPSLYVVFDKRVTQKLGRRHGNWELHTARGRGGGGGGDDGATHPDSHPVATTVTAVGYMCTTTSPSTNGLHMTLTSRPAQTI